MARSTGSKALPPSTARAFYGLPANDETITLTRGTPVEYPAQIATPEGPVTLFDPQMPLHWSVS